MYELNENDKRPLYQQIIDQTIEGLVKGYYRPGDKLPSVREMAKMLLVNQSTIVKSYKELEEMGIIETVVGSGTYISLNEEKLKKQREYALEEMKGIISRIIFLGVKKEEVLKIYEEVEEGVRI